MRSEPQPAPGGALSLQGVRKSFGTTTAVDGVDLDIAPGEFMTFLGPSGSGKTTTLNMIAGFVAPTAGRIRLGDRDISRVPSHRRGIGMVFQNYALFPHMTVEQNVAYPLKQRRVSRPERIRRVGEALALVQLEGFGHRRPAELSGGQQQRVALARAMVFRPPVLLMDEPLGALDKRLREALQLEIRRIHRDVGITFVYVTHDQDEALLLSDRIAIFNDGRIEQVGVAEDLYERPSTTFVAEFVGDSNLLGGVVAASGHGLRLDDGVEVRVACEPGAASRPATVVLRPERVRVRPAELGASTSDNALEAVVTEVLYLGSTRKVEAHTRSGLRLLARETAGSWSDTRPGDAVRLCWQASDCAVIDADRAR